MAFRSEWKWTNWEHIDLLSLILLLKNTWLMSQTTNLQSLWPSFTVVTILWELKVAERITLIIRITFICVNLTKLETSFTSYWNVHFVQIYISTKMETKTHPLCYYQLLNKKLESYVHFKFKVCNQQLQEVGI